MYKPFTLLTALDVGASGAVFISINASEGEGNKELCAEFVFDIAQPLLSKTV